VAPNVSDQVIEIPVKSNEPVKAVPGYFAR